MKIIISPAKKMSIHTDTLPAKTLPLFLKEAEYLVQFLKSLSYADLKKIFACNDAIADENFQRYRCMNLKTAQSPAILSYQGIQYQYMAPHVFEYRYFDYIEEHLRILSGLYGILRPLDAVEPYRLEMQAKLPAGFFKNTKPCQNLYDYWGSSLYKALTNNDKLIINLASNEYSKIIKKYAKTDIRLITCTFAELVNGRPVEKGVYVKMARGEMVRFMAEKNIADPKELCTFNRLDYVFCENLSADDNYVFIKQAK